MRIVQFPLPAESRGTFAALTAVLLYALIANIVDKPDGIAISGFFILGIITVSLISRISRATELRADRIVFDDTASRYIADTLAHDQSIKIIANRRQAGDDAVPGGSWFPTAPTSGCWWNGWSSTRCPRTCPAR